MEYVHSETEDLDYDLTEKVLEYDGKRILYLLSELISGFTLGCDGSCIQPSEARTVYVKGYIIKWQHRTDEANRAVSEVDPVTKGQDEIKKIIESEQATSKIYFDS